MAWIKIEHHTPDKDELWAIAQQLGLDVDTVLGKLVRLFIWADQNLSAERPHCVLSLSAISTMLRCNGFAEALAEAGWLHEKNGKTEFVNFDRHNGNSAKRRALDTERKRESRVRKVSAKCPPQKRTREEKRREEKKIDTSYQSPLPPSGGEVVEGVTAGMLAVYARWEQYRKEIKKPITPSSRTQLLRDFVKWGEARAEAAVSYTIGKGWQGLVEPETRTNGKSGGGQPRGFGHNEQGQFKVSLEGLKIV